MNDDTKAAIAVRSEQHGLPVAAVLVLVQELIDDQILRTLVLGSSLDPVAAARVRLGPLARAMPHGTGE